MTLKVTQAQNVLVMHVAGTEVFDLLAPVSRSAAIATLSQVLLSAIPRASLSPLSDTAWALHAPLSLRALRALESQVSASLCVLGPDLSDALHPMATTAPCPTNVPLARIVRSLATDLYLKARLEATEGVRALRQLLSCNSLRCEYHPIIDITTKEILGLEALARGTVAGLESPLVLFALARSCNSVHALSTLCRQKALEGFTAQTALLFVNVDPLDFEDPSFTPHSLLDHPMPLEPNRVVLEITEQSAIEDYPHLCRRLEPFLQEGYRFAVDDAGSGYAGLGSIANLEPHFIKLDRGLITGIDSSQTKQDLVQAMVMFAAEQGCAMIAEGVETKEEAETLWRLGIPYVQGFYYHHPSTL